MNARDGSEETLLHRQVSYFPSVHRVWFSGVKLSPTRSTCTAEILQFKRKEQITKVLWVSWELQLLWNHSRMLSNILKIFME